MPTFPAHEQPVIATELLPAPAKPAVPAHHPPPPPRHKAKPPRPATRPAVAPVVAPVSTPAVETMPVAAPLPAGVPDVPNVGEQPAAPSTTPPASQQPGDTAAPAAPDKAGKRYTFSPPPSAQLEYEVIALREEQKWYGSGKFDWVVSGDRYSITAEAGITILFRITVLNFRSEGTIDEFGISPVLYSEKPFRKSMTNTHFQRARKLISFSASTATYPYNGGEQDRASVIWQLASIGRGDPAQFAPGNQIDLFVAGTRDAETWPMQVVGEEEIETGLGRMRAWHVVRMPRPGTYDQRIDIWLAPQQEWYPARVRYTYPNKDYIELSLSSLQPAAKP